MIRYRPCKQFAAAGWDTKCVEGALMISFVMALRGLLVATTAVATIAYLLLTNSHI
jgi:ABC-type phosphate/phosphonate transport system permease subunit